MPKPSHAWHPLAGLRPADPSPRPPLGEFSWRQGVRPRARLDVAIRVLAPDLFRWRIRRSATALLPPSPALAPASWTPPATRVSRRASLCRISTDEASLTLNLRSGAWTFADARGTPLFTATGGDTGFLGREPRFTLQLAPREALFGLGETTGPFNKRGMVRDFWNIDVLGHSPCIHPQLPSLYVSIPFALSLRDGRAAGLLWDNPARQSWDLGQTQLDRWQMRAASGEIDLYLFAGPTPERVIQRFTELTGRLPLPPRWALGYHQSRYSYASSAELERIAREFRRRQLPCDALHCDIHHLDGYRVFTFGKSYPRPRDLLARLARRGFKVVTIVDPGVKDDPRFAVLRRGRQIDAFVKDPTGRRDFLGKAWPGRVRFPDFLNASVRSWWGREQRALLDLGVAGFWNDMNEPANFARPDKTLDPRCLHGTDHGRRRHAEVHNLYGMAMAQASREGALAWTGRRRSPDASRAPQDIPRPFVITRAGYAGIQRHALVWTGDNSSTWEHLADAVQMFLNLGLSGVPFVGADVGGFLGNATPELFLRWLQMAVFTPFLRNHSNLGTIPQEPWAFGPEIEAIARRYLQLRYQLLPHLYGLFAEAARGGAPIVRPLLWHYPNDPIAVACGDQFLLGSNLLVAPILHQGAVARAVYLPRGEWFDFWTGEKHTGGTHRVAPAPLDRIPVFVQAGSILPFTESRPFIGPREPTTVFLHVWPDDHGRLEWYDDDGRTQAYTREHTQRRQLTVTPSVDGTAGGRLHIGAPAGPYRGEVRAWRVVLRNLVRRPRVRVDGRFPAVDWAPEARLAAFSLPARDTDVIATWS